MQKLNDYIDEKKIKSSKTPRYGMKKLAVGLVSCILGYTVLVSPSVAHAEEVREPQAVVMEAEEEEIKEEAALPEETEVVEEQEQAEEIVEEENALQVSEEEEKEAVTAAETKEETEEESAEEVTEEDEEETEKKLVTLDEYNALQEEENEEDGINIEDAELVSNVMGLASDKTVAELEVGEEVDLEAQTAGEASEEAKKGKDISNDIINPSVSIRTESTETDGTLNAALGEQLRWVVSFTTPEGTKEGDTFTVKLSDNMSLKGLEPDTDYALPIVVGGKEIATGKRIDRQTIQYTFTKEINDMRNARVYIVNSAQENREKVQNTSEQTFKVNVGKKAADEKNIKVDFGAVIHDKNDGILNGKSQFTSYNPEDGSFTQVFYLNPESKEIKVSSTNDQNGREFGKVGFLLSSPHDANKPRSIDFKNDKKTKIEIKKLPKGAKLPDAVIENPEGAQIATNVQGGFQDFKGEPMFIMNFGNGNKIDSPYVVVVKGHVNEVGGKYLDLYSNGAFYGDGMNSLFMDNQFTFLDNTTAADGEVIGYFEEHHIYITKKDGEETERFSLPGTKLSGTSSEFYYTNKNELDGFKFVKIGEGENAPKNDPAYNTLGDLASGNFKEKTIKEVTYIYVKDIITKGSFTEHHVYEVYKDGVKQEDQTTKIDIEKTTGPEKDTFTTSAKPNGTADDVKAGFKLAENGITKSDEITGTLTGDEVSKNYINEKDLEVTYTYRKDITTKGSFTEHHVYEVYKDGVKQEDQTTKIDIAKTEGPEKDKFTTSAKPNGTADDVKAGFKLAENGITKSEEITGTLTGAEVSKNYINEKDLQVTYVYRKDITTKGSFKEKHIYKVYKDGVLQEDETTEIEITSSADGKKFEGTEKESFKTSAKPNGTADDVKEGFKLVPEEIKKSIAIDKTLGIEEVEFNYINENELQAVYVYRKDITSKKPTTPEEQPDPKEPIIPVIHEDPTPEPNPTPDPTPTPEETPVEEPKEDPAPKQEEEKPEPKTEEPKTEEPKEEETPEETPVEEPKEEEKEVVIEKEEDDEADRTKDTTPKHEGKEDYSKAPQTGVAGATGYLGLAGLGTALLAALEDKKKKKNK